MRTQDDTSARLHAAIPGGAHTYAKGDDQYPANAPATIARGSGCRVWDPDGKELVEYGSGLRAVTLGHAYAPLERNYDASAVCRVARSIGEQVCRTSATHQGAS